MSYFGTKFQGILKQRKSLKALKPFTVAAFKGLEEIKRPD